MSGNQMQVIRLLNPFDPRERVYESLEWQAGKTLADYFPYSPLHTNEIVVSVSGKVVMPENFATTRLLLEDDLVICPVPLGGGGGGKSILRIVAMIAIAVYAPGLLVEFGPVGMGVTSAAGITTLTAAGTWAMAGITIAGSMLVNALLPIKPAQKEQATARDDLANSQSYGVDGAKNSATEGIPVPVCYGTFRMGGNLANFYVQNVGNTQVLYMLFVAGEGPIANITDIQLNDQPITNFSNYEVLTRLGGDVQPLIPWFDDQVEPHSINLITAHDSYVNYTTSQEVDKFRVDMVAPSGLYEVDTNTGATSGKTVDFIIEYRKVGDVAWTQLTDTNGIIGYNTVQECTTFSEPDQMSDD
jgi:predicted phage tail protein